MPLADMSFRQLDDNTWLDAMEQTVIYWDSDFDPAGTRSTSKYDAIVVALQGRPGSWAVVSTGDRVVGTAQPAVAHALRLRGCEVTTRRIGDGIVNTWARWVDQ